jgi:hypothetical protein
MMQFPAGASNQKIRTFLAWKHPNATNSNESAATKRMALLTVDRLCRGSRLRNLAGRLGKTAHARVVRAREAWRERLHYAVHRTHFSTA